MGVAGLQAHRWLGIMSRSISMISVS